VLTARCNLHRDGLKKHLHGGDHQQQEDLFTRYNVFVDGTEQQVSSNEPSWLSNLRGL